jgi:DNA-binding GntR family transcriptional regulator
VVASISVKDIQDIFEIRLSLEVLTARLAAHRVDPAGAAMLGELVAKASVASSAGELAALNTAFHTEICRMSGNALLVGIMETLHDRIQWIYHQTAVDRAPGSWTEHEALAAAICAGDPEAAAEAAHKHVLAARHAAIAMAGDGDDEPAPAVNDPRRTPAGRADRPQRTAARSGGRGSPPRGVPGSSRR